MPFSWLLSACIEMPFLLCHYQLNINNCFGFFERVLSRCLFQDSDKIPTSIGLKGFLDYGDSGILGLVED